MFEQVEAFHRPASVREAVRLLAYEKGRARLLAGGTDLVVEGDPTIRSLIDITHSGLNYIRSKADVLAIGAATTMADLRESRAVRRWAGGILARAAATCGSLQNQAAATVGGNIAHGSPAADLVTPLLVLDAVLVIAGPKGRRKMALSDYLALHDSKATRQSLLVEVIVPAAKGRRSGWSFQKLGRTALDISLVNVAAGLQVGRGQVIEWARIALGAVAPTVTRASEVERALTGRRLDQSAIDEAGTAIAKSVSPISDVRATAEYRREMSGVLVRRALEDCARQAGVAL